MEKSGKSWKAYKPVEINLKSLAECFKRYSQDRERNFEQGSYERAWELVEEWLDLKRCRVLSHDEAMSKLPDLATSPGMPLRKAYKTKREVLEKFGDGYIKDFYDTLSISSRFLWHVLPKDELLPREAVETRQKVRPIIGSPMEATVAYRRLCHDFNEQVASQDELFYLGKSRFRGDYNTMMQKFLGSVLEEVDLKQCDASQSAASRWRLCELRCKYLDSEADKEKLRVMYHNDIHAWMATWDGHIVRKTRGLTTGGFNTLTDNSLTILHMLIYTALQEGVEASLGSVAKVIQAVVFGDDSLVTQNDILNTQTLTLRAKELGYVLEASHLGRPLLQTQFIGCRTLEKDGVLFPYPDPQKTFSAICFCRKPASPARVLMRLAGHRINSFMDVEQRNVLKKIGIFWKNKYSKALAADKDGPAALKSWMSDEDILDLYTNPKSQVLLPADWEKHLYIRR